MSARYRVSSASPYEDIIGFSRAVRVGNLIFVSGSGSIDSGGQAALPGDAYAQATRCLEIIRDAVEQAGGSIDDVVRTRMYLTDISKWEEVGRAHGEFFPTVKPAATMVEVSGLVGDDWLVEIEAEAVEEDG